MKERNIKIVKIIGILLAIPVALFILASLLTIGASVEKTVAQDPSIPHVTINEVTFHSESFGNPDNPVVIVVHGGPGNDYRGLLSLKELSDEYFIVFYDQRGTGLSPRVDASELTFDLTVSDLNRIVDHYSSGEKVNLIGHSWGAMVVSPYLGKYPEKVNKAVLSEPGLLTAETARMYFAYFGGKMAEVKPESRFNKIQNWFELLHIKEFDGQEKADYEYMKNALTEDGKPRQSEYYCNGEFASNEPHKWRDSALASSSIQYIDGPKSEFITMTEQGPDFNLVKNVDKFTDKVLFIASECNTIIGEDIQKIHIKSFPNAELKIIEDAGHDMYAGKPEAMQKVIREYFEEDTSVSNSRAIECLPEQRDVDGCIEIYQPVCATVNVQCITTPCDPVKETFENSCKACVNSLVSAYTEGECSI